MMKSLGNKGIEMIEISNMSCLEKNNIPVDDFWNFGERKELNMHNIHAYPAKFPAFIASKAFDYAENEGVFLKTVADVFCGCGTVALEAKCKGIDFWGCDINPVATLIAKAKSNTYNSEKLLLFYNKINEYIASGNYDQDDYSNANERLRYWFEEKNYHTLSKIKSAIDHSIRACL